MDSNPRTESDARTDRAAGTGLPARPVYTDKETDRRHGIPSPPPHSAQSAAEDDTRREIMAEISPEGMPAGESDSRRGRMLFVMVAVVLGVGTVIAMFMAGGMAALAIAGVYLIALIAAWMPVWGAGLLRQKEEAQATTEAAERVSTKRWIWRSGSPRP